MHSDSYKQYSGRLSDGTAALTQPVILRLRPEGIEIDAGLNMASTASAGSGSPIQTWDYADLTAAVPTTAKSSEILLSNKQLPGSTLFVTDGNFAENLIQLAPEIGAKHWRIAGLIPSVGITLVIALMAGIIWATGYSPSKMIAKTIPHHIRATLGDRVITSLSRRKRVCHAPKGRAALNAMMARLADGAGIEKPFDVTVINWRLVNAFAAPGGRLVLTRGLIKKATSAEMVAGVMAHEMGHGLELHPESGLVRAVGLSAAAEFFFTGSSGTLKNIGTLLATLQYTREAETVADQRGLAILRNAAISAKPLANFFDRLGKKEARTSIGKAMRKMRFLSTHPPSPERAKMIAAQPTYQTMPVLTSAQWLALKEICGKKRRRPSYRQRRIKRIAALKQKIVRQSALITAKPNMAATAAIYRQRAITYRKLKEYDLAIADYSKAIELDPAVIRNYKDRSSLYKRLKKLDLAIADYTLLIKLQPTHAYHYARRAWLYRQQQKFDKAIADLDKAISLEWKRHKLWRNRAMVHFENKQWDEAISDYTSALKLSPGRTSYYFARSQAYRMRGNLLQAMEDAQTGLKKLPKSATGLRERGMIWLAMGLHKAAIIDLTAALKRAPSTIQVRTARGEAFELAGERERAIKDYRAAMKHKPYSRQALAARSKARQRLKVLGVSEQ